MVHFDMVQISIPHFPKFTKSTLLKKTAYLMFLKRFHHKAFDFFCIKYDISMIIITVVRKILNPAKFVPEKNEPKPFYCIAL